MDWRHVLEVNPTRSARRLDTGGEMETEILSINYKFWFAELDNDVVC